MGGIECARQIKDAHPDTEMVFQLLAAGESGHLLKCADREERVSAIHQVVNGGSPMTSHICRRPVIASGFERFAGLWERSLLWDFHPGPIARRLR